MRLSEVDQGQQSWAALLIGPIQEDYRDVLNSEIALAAKKKPKKKSDRTDCGEGCSPRPPKKGDKTDCGQGCSPRPPKKGDRTDCGQGCSPPPPKKRTRTDCG